MCKRPTAVADNLQADGNITGKSDVGIYSYGKHNGGPHAVGPIDTTAGENGGKQCFDTAAVAA